MMIGKPLVYNYVGTLRTPFFPIGANDLFNRAVLLEPKYAIAQDYK
jgi:hypothetical protein